MTMSSSINDDVIRSLRHQLLLLVAVSLAVTLQHTITESALCDFNPPLGESFISITNVTENLPIGSTLYQLSIAGSSREISLSLSANSPNSFDIALNETSRTIYARSRLEVLLSAGTNPHTDQYILTCTVLQTTAKVVTPVFLTVFDTNDHSPIFNASYYTATVSESTPIGSVIATVMATDLDLSDLGVLVYNIDNTSSPYASSFTTKLAASGGSSSQIVCRILLQRPLSYEHAASINLTIVVKDNGDNHLVLGVRQPQFNATTSLFITVTSATDYNPLFTQNTYVATVDRNAPLGTLLSVAPPIGAVIPHDLTYTGLVYSIVRDPTNGGDQSYFSINNFTGQIMTSSPFDASTPSHLAFQIQVTELMSVRRYSAALVKVVIVSSPSAGSTIPPPIFSQPVYNVTMSSDSPVGSLVTVLTVKMACLYWTGNYSTSVLTYSFIFPGYADFFINRNNGEIRTARILNYDVTHSYVLQVQVTDGFLVNTSSVAVTLLPPTKCDAGPQFTNHVYKFNATRNSDVIGLIQANTFNQAITYSLDDSSSQHPGLFTITSGGQLRRSSIPASDDVTVYTLVVVATDNSAVPPRRSAAVVVVHWWSTGDVTQVVSSPSSLTSQPPNGYLIGLIIIGVVGGFLLLVVISLLIFISRKTVRTCEQVQQSHSDLHNGSVSQHRSAENLYENGFRATDDFHGLMFPTHVGESSTDVALGLKGGRSPLSSASSKLNERSTSVDGSSKNSVKLIPGFSNGVITGQVSTSATAESPGTRSTSLLDSSSFLVGMDPGVISSTETLMGPSHTAPSVPVGSSRTYHGQVPARQPPYTSTGPLSFVGSNQSSIYMSSPDGSMMSVTTQAKSDDGTGITVYY